MVNLHNDQQYNGPFADIEEHRFYTVIPDLEELVPALYQRKARQNAKEGGSSKKSNPSHGHVPQNQINSSLPPDVLTMQNDQGKEILMRVLDDGTMVEVKNSSQQEQEQEQEQDAMKSNDGEIQAEESGEGDEVGEGKIEEELRLMEEKYSSLVNNEDDPLSEAPTYNTSKDDREEEDEKDEEKDEDGNDNENTLTSSTHSVSKHVHIADIQDITFMEKVDILMDRLLQCYSDDDVDRWCLEFCDMNQQATQEALLEKIFYNYRKTEHQPFLARAIRELRPAFPKLEEEVKDIVFVCEMDELIVVIVVIDIDYHHH